VRFLANDALVETATPGAAGGKAWGLAPALDFIRGELRLEGTKEGCREGDCGACAVLVGSRAAAPSGSGSGSAGFAYRAMPSCLLALGELEGRHLVTIEGLAACGIPDVERGAKGVRLTPVMRAISEANGSQCGFCTPGFVISLTAYLLNGDADAPGGARAGALSLEGAISAVEGNLCRCTGYASIKRAAARLVGDFADLPREPPERLEALVAAHVLPASCAAFARGELLSTEGPEAPSPGDEAGPSGPCALSLGGGTDYLVRNPEPDPAIRASFDLLDRRDSLRRVERVGLSLELGAALSWREFFANPLLRGLVPGIERFEAKLASPLVRERATLGGNIANASPVGDLVSMLIALGASVRLEMPAAGPARGDSPRELALERLFLGYKSLDLAPGEIIATVLIPAERPVSLFNFEKVSKRERLDIAAVNTAISLELGPDGRVTRARISGGGVAPVPLLLAEASGVLLGRRIDAETALEAARLAAAEATPIGDVRGSAGYRRRLLERLVLAHFIELFPGSGIEEALA
jgi:xanthine dehydrogenase small subunit